MGKPVSVYIDEKLLEAAKETGKPFSQVVREALEMYLGLEERKKRAKEFMSILSKIPLEVLIEGYKKALHERERER